MLKGLIAPDGKLWETDDVIEYAKENENWNGLPLSILEIMLLRNRGSKHPSASSLARLSYRQTALEQILDFYADPRDRMPLIRGTLIHHGFDKIKVKSLEAKQEWHISARCPYNDEIILTGHVDLYYPDKRLLIDHKTTTSIPEYIKPDHIRQLAIYVWLARWGKGVDVSKVGINYISWRDAKQVFKVSADKEAIDLPLFQDPMVFMSTLEESWEILNAAWTNNVVPPHHECVHRYCRYCPVKWACDRIQPYGDYIKIDPEEWKQPVRSW